jgi:hypothetical protein
MRRDLIRALALVERLPLAETHPQRLELESILLSMLVRVERAEKELARRSFN